MNERPSGTVAFLFTDIEGSTRLWEENPADMARRVADHDQIVHDTVDRHGGTIFSSQGDSFAAAFDTTADALAAAVDAQLAVRDLVAVRMAVHVGPADARDGGYFGPTLNRCGRLRDAAHGGQIICSQAVADLTTELPPGTGLVDLGEHRLRDLGRPEHVHQVSHPDLASEFPPLDTLRMEKTNLPIQVTSFVGRHQELAEVDKLIRASRLVTLTGAGGCGKSRLAMETAAGLADEYPDGVWMVELASIDDPDLVASGLASALGVQEQTDSTLTDALLTHLKDRHLLVILDNCEHVLDALTPLVHEVVTTTADVRVLATSREPMHLPGETTYLVPPLPLPEPGADVGVVAHADAVRLFVERATAVSPDFHLAADNAPVIASICRHLDGIPLAIELAAATVRLLPIDQIAAHLDDRFGLLAGPSRDPIPHHRTLEAAIDWSYEQLTQEQQTLFGRLAVFEGGWTLDAAEAVCPGAPIDEDAVLPLLTGLVDQSLVAIVADGRTARYRYLESIHAYAADRGQVADELRRRHASWCQAFAERVRPWITADRTEEALAAFRAEMPNMRAALHYYFDTGDPHGYCALLAALRRFLFINRSYAESDRFYDRALRLLTEELPPGLRGEILMGAGWNMSRAHGLQSETVSNLLHEAVAFLGTAGDDRHLSEAYSYLTVHEQNAEYAELALQAAERSGDPTAMARPHHYLGITEFLSGDYEQAMDHFRQAIAGLTEAHLRAFATIWLATTLVRCGQPEEALELANHALATFEAIADGGGLERALHTIGEIALVSDRTDLALSAMSRRIDTKATYVVDTGAYATAAHAAAQAGDTGMTLAHLEVVGSIPGSDFLLEDNLDHAFLAVAQLGLHHGDADIATQALAAETTYRASHKVLPNVARERLIDRLVEQTRTRLSSDDLDAAWSDGADATLDEIIELARDRYQGRELIDPPSG